MTAVALTPILPALAAQIGRLIGDPFVAHGHPLTCNGGNPDWERRHDHEVLLQLNDGGNLECPECGRIQELPTEPTREHMAAWLRGDEKHRDEDEEKEWTHGEDHCS